MRRRKKNEANSCHTRPSKNQCPGPKPIYQMTHDRTFNPSFKAGGTIEEGNCGAAHRKIALQGQEKNGETVVENPRSNGGNEGSEDYDPPPVKDPTSQ